MSKETKQLTADSEDLEYKLNLRNIEKKDIPHILELTNKIYSKLNDNWTYEQIEALLKVFPEGQICIEDKGEIVACAFSIIVDYEKFGDKHTYNQITANCTFTTHDYDGDVLYGVDIFVHPDYQGLRLGRRLYDARKEMCENLNLKSIIAGGRIPGYTKYANKLTPREYIDKVKAKEIYDPILTFQLSNDFQVKKVLKNYLPSDNESHAYASLLQWHNIYYEEENDKIINTQTQVVRIGIVQWQMRTLTLETLFAQIEFYVDTISAYNADFVLFPEFFNAPLMSKYNNLNAADAIRKLAGYTDEIVEKMMEFAIAYNINIIAGSMPVYENEKLYNVSYLCRRDGTWDEQYKLHITPDEAREWGMQGGNKLKAFDTDVCKIGILICYDVEFPELSRFLADQGVKILFVPFLTDTVNAYNRVRLCAQARAIENEFYVALGGSVGNLPRVNNMGLQYAQSAVFSPSDFNFPKDGIISEATPNTEMAVIADVDLYSLKELHQQGSVRNLIDRRKDLFELKWKGK
ncbi:MAG: bifunctional GNAT family N-acetyltransferase/carbon-nitrogen hydrolase family protein [Microscillaceae bacterium]|nr:bifunctional GNAT family N-acetyltransferase/carbon-nitrogen hydrolase family protein [Microscillaceae bacterium]MDW8461858.1 bifunctional GNAT family N-acetyltransferase/carbon-nitrogen hydrolase family protein [Cytophagales bacterium]